MKTKIRNFTPHEVVVRLDDETEHAFPSEGNARVSANPEPIGEIGGIPLVQTKYGEVVGLPKAQMGDILIVSRIVLEAIKVQMPSMLGFLQIVCPDTSPDSAVRDEDGQIIAVRRFTK